VKQPSTDINAGQGWLATVLPAEARRFRVADRFLAESLAEAGAEIVEQSPEVEIALRAEDLRGDAPLGIVTLAWSPRSGGGLALRVGSRSTAALRSRLASTRARRELTVQGYDDVAVVPWEMRHRAALPNVPLRRTLSERLPGRALVIGRRGPRRPTALEAALAAAERASGIELPLRWASIRAGTVIAASDAALLRVAIGNSRVQVVNQVDALEAMQDARAPSVVLERLPSLIAHGREGLADWSLERLLPGARPPFELTPALVDECVDFLVGLQRVREERPHPARLVDLAETVASVCRPESGATVRRLGEWLERELAGLERGFGHGDFFPGNLLAVGDRLTGVLDWDAAGPGRLPLVDLFHLEVTRRPYGSDDRWGRAVLERLLPVARDGGDAALRRYCREVDLAADARVLQALVSAYWLEYAAYQLRTHRDRHLQPDWIKNNVELVALEMSSLLGRR
jgi:Phosphotransferase enzyme family